MLPRILIPQKHSYRVNDGGSPEFDDDTLSLVVVDGVPCEAAVQIIVCGVAIEK